MSDELRGRIQDFLRLVAQARKAPLHAATAWNALYFGYDLNDHTYRGVIDYDGFVDVRLVPCPPLPVGAFVQYERGEHLIWGEVVAAFGNVAEAFADSMGSLDAEWRIPSPRDVHAGIAEQDSFDELTIVDWGVITALDKRDIAELLRARRRAARGLAAGLDVSGHVSGPREHRRLPEVLGEPQSDSAPVDDLAAYADHLLRYHRRLVNGGFIADILRDPGDTAVLRGALLTSMITVAELLAETPGLVFWSGYAVPEERYTARGASEDLLGGADLQELARIAARPCDRPRRLAVMPALVGLAGSARQATDEQYESVFAGVGLAETVVQANVFLAARAGLAGNLERLRLIDDWQAGGIWEMAPVLADAACPDDAVEGEDVSTERGETALESDALDPELEELLSRLTRMSDTMTVHTVMLSAAEVAEGTLLLSADIRAALGERRCFGVDLYQPGTTLLPAEATQAATAERGALRLFWPLTVAAGAHAVIGVPATGARLRIDVVERPPTPADPPTGRAGPHGTLQRMILDCVRRTGTPGPGGSRALPGERLRQEVAAAWQAGGAAVPVDPRDFVFACRALVDDRRLQVTEGTTETGPDSAITRRSPDTYTWWPHGVWETTAAEPGAASGLADAVKGLHWVPGFIRALPPGKRASRRAREDHAAWALAHGYPTELGPGTTFVRGHHRGQEDALGRAMEPDRETW